MTTVVIAATSVVTESTTGNSPRVLTPQSSMDFSPGPANGNASSSEPSGHDISASSSQDQPIPTIERDPDDTSTPSTRPLCAAKGKGRDVAPGSHVTDGIGAGIESMRISSPGSGLDMSDVAAAIEGISSSSGNGAALLDPGRLDTERNSPYRRRRSSSRINTPVHNVQDEEPPQDRFHKPAFQKAFGDAKRIMSELSNVLGSNSLHIDPDSTMQRLHREAGDLAIFQCPSSRTVGFVGDSGVGKSSLLNSLLDRPELARASNSGAACTCVVTEYHYHDSDTFDIEMELFSIDDIMEQMTELVRCYRTYHLNHTNMEVAEEEECKEKAQIAQDTFRTMFRGLIDSEQFLINDQENAVLGTLRSWAEQIRPSPIGERGVRLTMGECSDLLLQLTSEQTSAREPAAWPYIRKIKVSLNAHILSKGLVLVDLPGLRDLNSARRNITERYLIQCDEIFAVCHIGRATTDAGVMSVFELARQAQLSNIGIICTKSDDIRAEEAKKDWEGTRAQDIQRLLDAVDKDRRVLHNLEAELEDHVHSDMSEGEKDHEVRLGRRFRNTKKLMNDHQFELKQYLVQTRNNSITRQLTELYRSRVPAGQMRVFCVSNTDYWIHRGDALHVLQLTGIIPVRKHCISMVAESQLRSATKYIRDSIPALLSDIALWVESGLGSVGTERKQLVCDALNVLEARIRRDLNGATSEIKSVARFMRREFEERIFQIRRIGDWSRSASDAAGEWSMWHHATYSAFCRNYGHYSTNAVGSHNWNEEVIQRMVQDLSAPWQGLRSILLGRNERTVVLIEELMDWAIQHLDTELQEDFSDLIPTLIEALTSRQHLLTADVAEVFEKFGAGISTLRIDALSGIRTSLIGRAIENSYRTCNQESGTGSHARRKRVINDRLGDERIFDDLMQNFRNGFRELANDLQNDIDAALETHLDVIRRTLDIIRTENAATESEQDPEFRGRVEVETRTAKDNIGRIQAAITH